MSRSYIRSCLYQWEQVITQRGGPLFQSNPAIKLAYQHLLPMKKETTTRQKTAVTLEMIIFLNKYLEHLLDVVSIKGILALRDLIYCNISFFGLLRRSDAHSLSLSNIQTEHSSEFLLAHIDRSKTDQEGNGYTLPIFLTTPHL